MWAWNYADENGFFSQKPLVPRIVEYGCIDGATRISSSKFAGLHGREPSGSHTVNIIVAMLHA